MQRDLDLINKDTVFILGAGASCHYGYPTGEDLVAKIINLSLVVSQYARAKAGARHVYKVPACVFELLDKKPNVSLEYAARDESIAQQVVNAWSKLGEDCEKLHDRLQTISPLLIDNFLAWNPTLQNIGKLLIAGAIIEAELFWNNNHFIRQKINTGIVSLCIA
jgi:hypothetical protein